MLKMNNHRPKDKSLQCRQPCEENILILYALMTRSSLFFFNLMKTCLSFATISYVLGISNLRKAFPIKD